MWHVLRQHQPGGGAGDKYQWRSLTTGVNRIPVGVVGWAQMTPRRRGNILLVISALHGGVAPAAWSERFHISSGERGTALVRRRPIPGPE